MARRQPLWSVLLSRAAELQEQMSFQSFGGCRDLKGALRGSAGGGTAAFPGLVSKTTNYPRTDTQKQLLACSNCLKERKQQQQQKKGKKTHHTAQHLTAFHL